MRIVFIVRIYKEKMKIKGMFLFLFLLLSPQRAHAEAWIVINDMSQLKWQMAPNGVVYLRNLNQFNPHALPCCYNYSIDTTTAAGKSMWSVILIHMASSKKLILGVATLNKSGPITYLGEW